MSGLTNGKDTICLGESKTLNFTGTAPFNISFTSGGTPYSINNITTNTYDVPSLETGLFTFELTGLTDALGCGYDVAHSTTSAEILVTNPTVTIDATPATMYLGETRTFTFTGGVAPYKLHYTDNVWGAGVITSDADGIAIITAEVVDTFTFNFVSVEDATGCTNYSGIPTWTVIVFKAPTVTANVAEICEGETVTLTFEGVAPFYVDYTPVIDGLPTKFGGDGYPLTAISQGVYQAEIAAVNIGTFDFEGTITDANGNSNSVLFTIKVNPKPTVIFPAIVDPCDGGDILVTLTGTQPFVVDYTVSVAGKAAVPASKLGLGNIFGDGGYALTPTGNPNEYYVIITSGSSSIMTFNVNSVYDANGCVVEY
jgi:hypothetical protein